MRVTVAEVKFDNPDWLWKNGTEDLTRLGVSAIINALMEIGNGKIEEYSEGRLATWGFRWPRVSEITYGTAPRVMYFRHHAGKLLVEIDSQYLKNGTLDSKQRDFLKKFTAEIQKNYQIVQVC